MQLCYLAGLSEPRITQDFADYADKKDRGSESPPTEEEEKRGGWKDGRNVRSGMETVPTWYLNQ